jgi:Xaa-Pro dipeptidase
MNISPIYTPPSEDELNSRKEKLLKLMDNSKLDAFVIADPDNIFWLTNFANYVHERPFILILSKCGSLSFIIPKLEKMHAESRVIGQIEYLMYEEFPYAGKGSWDLLFTAEISKYTNVGLEETAPQFVANLITTKTISSELVEVARYIKSDYEIGRIVYSSNIASKSLEKLLSMAAPGVSLLSVNSKITKLMLLQMLTDNPESNPLATNVAAVVQPPAVSDDPHNFTNIMEMDMAAGGPHVSIINGTINGYGTEVERTFFLGKVPKKAIKPYEVMMEVRGLCYELCVPGADMHDVDFKAKEVFKKYGYAENVVHRVGHSIGVTGHEGPFLAEGFHHEIQAGMLFTIEPGIYLEGIGGFRHSDTVLVTPDGNKNLTPVKDSLKDMTLSISALNFSSSPAFKKKLLKTYNRYFGLNIKLE